MFLKSIHLNNVKCFSDIALSFEDENGGIRKWTLLLAENGMGQVFAAHPCSRQRKQYKSVNLV